MGHVFRIKRIAELISYCSITTKGSTNITRVYNHSQPNTKSYPNPNPNPNSDPNYNPYYDTKQRAVVQC